MILGLYSYYTYMREVTKTVNVSMEATANQVQSRLDSVLISIRKYYVKYADSDEINAVLQSDLDYREYDKLTDATDIMDGPSYLMDYITGFSFINFNTNWVISNRGMFRYDEMTNKEEVEEVFAENPDSLTRYFWKVNAGSLSDMTLPRETINFDSMSLL